MGWITSLKHAPFIDYVTTELSNIIRKWNNKNTHKTTKADLYINYLSNKYKNNQNLNK